MMMALRTEMRRRLKRIFDHTGNDKLKLNFLRAVPIWIASLLTGLIAVFYSKVFLLAESSTSLLFKSFHWLLFIITPACFLMAWWLVVRYVKFAGGSGIPQVMAAIELANPRDNSKIRRLLSIRVIVIKIISSFFMILGGGIGTTGAGLLPMTPGSGLGLVQEITMIPIRKKDKMKGINIFII